MRELGLRPGAGRRAVIAADGVLDLVQQSHAILPMQMWSGRLKAARRRRIRAARAFATRRNCDYYLAMVGMKAEPRFSAVIPILNQGCSLPTSLPLAISPEIAFRKIRGDDLAIITEQDEDASSFIKGGTYTLTIDPFNSQEDENSINDKIIASLFAINILGDTIPISVDRIYVLRSLRRTTLSETRPLAGSYHTNRGRFKVKEDVDVSDAATLFAAIQASMPT